MIAFTVEDEDGQNPTGKLGSFDFDLDFEITAADPGYMYDSNGDGYPGHPATAELVTASCRRVWLEDEEPRQPTAEEQTVFTNWFFTWLADNPDVENDLCDNALEEVAAAYEDYEPSEDY
jgi:hypothetical protein